LEKTNKTRIGGQAVIEGVMMRGKTSAATAVGNGEKILVFSERLKSGKNSEIIKKIPFIRGVYNFVLSMAYGIGTLNKSASAAGEESEPTKFEKWLSKTFKIKAETFTAAVACVLGLAFAIGLFVLLPQVLIQPFINFNVKLPPNLSGFEGFLNGFLKNLLTGLIRIAVFLVYLLLVSRMKEIKRVFAYHGAEHKVINCYEYALPLTVANARKMTVKHERCGTTFIFLVMLVGVLFFSFFTFENNVLIRMLTRVALLPVVAGISYELLIFSSKHDNLFFRILRAPGMLLQKLTTNEPSDYMLEISLAAFKTVLAMDNNAEFPASSLENTVYPYAFVRDYVRERTEGLPADEADWIMAAALKKGRAALPLTEVVTLAEFEEMKDIIKKRKTGMPLQRAVGEADFFGMELDVEGVLIPRPETELLADAARKYIEKRLNAEEKEGKIRDSERKLLNAERERVSERERDSETGLENVKKTEVSERELENPEKTGVSETGLENAKKTGVSEELLNPERERVSGRESENAEKIEALENSLKTSGSKKSGTEKLRVLDLAAGSGAIALVLNKFFGERLEITASDISETALNTARKNAEKHNARINFVKSDMFAEIEGGFDVIVSNPPYIKTADIAALDTEVKDFEPKIALDGGADGLKFFREIAENRDRLNDGGRLFLEIGAGQKEDIEEIFHGAKIEFLKDYAGIDRIAAVEF
jgi:uncharacterized protein YqhQ/methylase of polypeptide subunit release factors